MTSIKKLGFFVVGIGILCVDCKAAIQSESFKGFISNPPITKKLAYRVHYSDSFTGITGSHVWRVYELKFQNNGVLISEENVLKDFGTNTSSGQRISCSYGEVHWQYVEDQRVLHLWTNKTATTLASADNLVLMAKNARNEASLILNGGIPDVPIGSVRWVGDHFIGTNITGSPVAGELKVAPNGTPQALRFEVQNGDQSWQYVAKYSFDGDVGAKIQIVPRRIDVCLVSGMKEEPYYTIFVDDLQLDSVQMQPGEFQAENYINTNAVRRVVYLDDKKIVVSPAGIVSTVLRESIPEQNPAKTKTKRGLVLLVLFVTSGVFSAALWVRRASAKSHQHQ